MVNIAKKHNKLDPNTRRNDGALVLFTVAYKGHHLSHFLVQSFKETLQYCDERRNLHQSASRS